MHNPTPTLLRESLGATLRYRRKRQGRTLRDISEAAKVSLGYLSEVERGRKEASSELLAAICEALEIDLAELLTDVSLELTKVQLATVTPLAPSRRRRAERQLMRTQPRAHAA